MRDENDIQNESELSNDNMISQDAFENALKQRLAEQTRKHQRELKRKEEEMENMKKQYENYSNNYENQDISREAARNVVDSSQQAVPGAHIPADKLPEIFDQYDRYKMEQEKRRLEEERQRRNAEAYQRKESQIADEVAKYYEKDPELQEMLKKHGNERQMLEEIGHHLISHPASKAPKILKRFLSSEENYKKFNNPDSNVIDKSEIIASIAANLDADKLAKSMPQPSVDFAIKNTSKSEKDLNNMNTREAREYYRKKGLYGL